MRVIFLDVDGVLNSATLWKRDKPKNSTYMSPELCVRFKGMLDRLPDVKIVVSSTWRMGFYNKIISMLSEYEVDSARFIGRTPNGCKKIPGSEHLYSSCERGEEIQEWLDENPGVESFVILDDNSDMAHLMPHLVLTTWADGLQDKHVEEIIKRLK